MSSERLRRIKKELAACQDNEDASSLVYCEQWEDAVDHVKGMIIGPEGTPYAGGTFIIDIKMPQEYPFRPPAMRFDTRVWHPNISSESGAICLDILKTEWSPVLTLRTALMSLQALMQSPEPDDPQDAEVASQYRRDRKEFEQTAASWTEIFAKNIDTTENKEKVQRIADMGFDRRRVKLVLQVFDFKENEALDLLLSK